MQIDFEKRLAAQCARVGSLKIRIADLQLELEDAEKDARATMRLRAEAAIVFEREQAARKEKAAIDAIGEGA